MKTGGEKMERVHGGDWAGFEERYGGPALDFSANTSPLGIPEGVYAAAAASLARADRYPDPACRALRRALAVRYDLPVDAILCGNGAADLLDRLAWALRPRRALLPAPCFTEYRTALERTGCEIRTAVLDVDAGFRPDERFLDQLTPDLDAVILCEPGNPAGRTTDRTLKEQIAERCDELSIWLLIDECFNDFLDDPDAHSMLGAVTRYRRLLVLRAFTKFYGMAGLRLGWCACGDPALLAGMRTAGQPWPVSVPAQAAGLAALEEREYAARLRALIRTERPRLRTALERCGCRVIPGEANFLLFYDAWPSLGERLAERGVMLRDCRDFEGLGPGWYRTAVRTREENEALIRALEEVHRWRSA